MNYKKLLPLLFSILFTLSYSQNKLSFTTNTTVSNTSKSKATLSKKFKNYKILKLNATAKKMESGDQISINYLQEYNYTLKENKILADNYTIRINGENGIENKTISDIGFAGKYFANADISATNEFVFSTFGKEYSIYIKNKTAEFYIEPLKKYNKNALSDDYVVYNVSDIVPENGSCGDSEAKTNTQNYKKANPTKKMAAGCKTIELAMSVDYTMYSTYGSVSAVIDRTLQVLNLTQANYTVLNGLSDDVFFKVTEHFIATCATCNYWAPTLEINTNYSQFSSNAYRMFLNPYDIKIHWQNQGGTGTVVGLGSYTMCGGSGIAVVKNYASDTNLIRSILSHEIGHNLGCVHNTGIMNPIVNQGDYWSPESIVTINNSFATLTCISNCNATSCDNKKVSNATVTSDIVNDKINVSWLAETGIDFKLRLYNYNNNTWTAYTTFSYPTNTTAYDFTQVHCSDKYRIEITPVCSGINGIMEQIVFEVNKNVPAPSLVFSSNAQIYPICGGKTTYFNVTATDGGTTPLYQWKINGTNVGTNTNSFSSNALVNGDILSCELTSNATCVTTPTASVSAVLNVTTPTELSVSITASATEICPGESITFTATGTNITSAFPYYTWYLNGAIFRGAGSNGASGSTLTDTPLNTGDVYTCKLSDGEGCHSNTTNPVSNPIAITLKTNCTLAVNDYDILGLNYYPNPVKNVLNISAKEYITAIKIYNLAGKKVLSKTVNTDKTILDMSHLPTASYLVKIETETGINTIKIVKD